MTMGGLQMTLSPPATVPMAGTSKILKKLSNIRGSNFYSTRLIEEKTYFSLFFGRWPTLSIYIYMKEYVLRYHQLRVRKYFTCDVSFTKNAIIIPGICSFCNFF